MLLVSCRTHTHFSQLRYPLSPFCFRLECEIEADIKPIEVKWTLDERELIQSDRIEMLYLDDVGLARLTVHDVTPADSGEYRCIVSGTIVEPTTGAELSKVIESGARVQIEGEFSADLSIWVAHTCHWSVGHLACSAM